MAKSVVNLGTAPLGAGGDDRRSAWLKGKANFTELFNWLSGRADGDDYATPLPAALPVSKGGTGGVTQAAARTGLGLADAAIRNAVGSVVAGDLMEAGTNSVGSYWRYQNGLQVCLISFVGYAAGAVVAKSLPAPFKSGTLPTSSHCIIPYGNWDHSGATTYCESNAVYFRSMVGWPQNQVQIMVVGWWK